MFLYVTAAVVLVMLLTVILMNRLSYDALRDNLKADTQLIADCIERTGKEYLETAELGDIRAILIGRDGRIIYAKKSSRIGTHAGYAEAAEAYENGTGSTSEFRLFAAQTEVNYAVRLSDGTVLRTAANPRSLLTMAEGFLGATIFILAAALLTAIILARAISKSIVRPINSIDLESPRAKGNYPELKPLLKRLRAQNSRVAIQMEELRRSREQFTAITESMSEGLIFASSKFTILSCNSAAFRLLGTEPAENGQSIFALNNTERFRRCIQDAAGGKRAECILEIEGTERQVIASPSGNYGTVNGIVVFIMDVTERTQLETMRREFTSNVSHELKTPLTTIYGIADMLANGMVKAEDVAQFGGNIRGESERLITLINDIVSLSKLDEGAVSDENEPVDLYALTEEIRERLKMSAEKRDITVSIHGEHITYNGNPMILDEIITNLCGNAIKYNCEGGRVDVKISHIPKFAMITVTDTGVGIPEQDMSRIFERFYRVDKSRSGKVKGTGLGLSIVKHGVMYHGGEVRAESTVGKGTAFIVKLPI